MESPRAPHPWNVTPTEAVALQKRLREQLILEPPAGLRITRLAGADISTEKGNDTGYGGMVVLDAETLLPVARAVATAPLTFPYVPGLLSFRELPVLAAVWERLTVRPDVLVFDGQGTAHPRRLGIACHGGLLFDIPSIGCAKSLLVGTPGKLAERRGATSPITHKGEVVGMAVRTRTGVSPVFVSPGHRMDLDTAVEWVLKASPRYREPETTRHAHRLVNAFRRAGGEAAELEEGSPG
ncbi:endonuclease V [Corallococcus sp. AB004]|uniref:deoxyribonuclease V n=1 Tax=Corallococcus exiguus TaxID=83462 RepID=UPI000EA3849B|nr:deoxyribonuclease V [Corallococcus exiguus]NPC71890.1 endonuclease V [Corallococcus exiguus]RKI43314.1 endonuclease V [Corallococcus sp. AB004]